VTEPRTTPRVAQARLEEAVQDVGQGKVGPQLLVGQLVARLAQPLRPERDVPVPQLALNPLPRAAQSLNIRTLLHGLILM